MVVRCAVLCALLLVVDVHAVRSQDLDEDGALGAVFDQKIGFLILHIRVASQWQLRRDGHVVDALDPAAAEYVDLVVVPEKALHADRFRTQPCSAGLTNVLSLSSGAMIFAVVAFAPYLLLPPLARLLGGAEN